MADTSHLELLERYKINRETLIPGSRRQVADNWIRGEKIGRGEYGAVYVENNKRTGKVRAVKEIWKRFDEKYPKAELVALTRLSKPAYEEYFVQFQGWYHDETSISLIMEYFEHGDLRKHMLDSFSESQAREIASQLFLGLQAMHNDGFTHRDLKPENIFVVRKEPSFHIKIGDFGVSKRIQNDNTNLYSRVGTLSYMAPEVLQLLPEAPESSIYDNKVDIWSAGVVLYEMLCVRRPFPTPHSISQYCCAQLDFPEAALRFRQVTQTGCNLIRLLLNPLPSDRPSVDSVLESEWFDEDVDIRTDLKSEDILPLEPVPVSQTDIHNSFSPTDHSASPHQSLRNLSSTSKDTTGGSNLQSSSSVGKETASREQLSSQAAVSDNVSTHQSIPSDPVGEGIVQQTENILIDLDTALQADNSANLGATYDLKCIRLSARNLSLADPNAGAEDNFQQESEVLTDSVLVNHREEPHSSFIHAGSESVIERGTDIPPSTGQAVGDGASPWRAYPLRFPNRLADGQHQTMRRYRAAACVKDDKIAYVIGGEIYRKDRYEVLGDTWSLKLRQTDILCEPLEVVGLKKREGHRAVYFENRIVVIGGTDEIGGVEDSFVSILGLGDGPPLPWRRYRTNSSKVGAADSHPISLVGQRLFAYSGVRPLLRGFSRLIMGGTLYSLNVPDCVNEDQVVRWNTLSSSGFGILGASMVAHQHQILLFGGRGFFDLGFVLQFDPMANSWRELGRDSMIEVPFDHSATVIGDNMYVHGGIRGGRACGELDAFHIPTQKWRRLRHHHHSPTPRYRHSMIAMGTRLVIFGGLFHQTASDYTTEGTYEPEIECAWVLDTAQDLDWVEI